MRAAARKAGRQIAALAVNREVDDYGDVVDTTDQHEVTENEEDDFGIEDTEEERNVFSFDIGSLDFRTGRRRKDRDSKRDLAEDPEDPVLVPTSTSTSPLRSVEYQETEMAAHRGTNGVARQAVRDGIVQQWQPGRTNGASTTTNGARAPPTPPMNQEDEEDFNRRELEAKIMRNVEENGIERPKGHSGTKDTIILPLQYRLTQM